MNQSLLSGDADAAVRIEHDVGAGWPFWRGHRRDGEGRHWLRFNSLDIVALVVSETIENGSLGLCKQVRYEQ